MAVKPKKGLMGRALMQALFPISAGWSGEWKASVATIRAYRGKAVGSLVLELEKFGTRNCFSAWPAFPPLQNIITISSLPCISSPTILSCDLTAPLSTCGFYYVYFFQL